MLPRLNPRQLETFIVAAELHSFRKAALRLHLSPSAVSNLIAELEATLGFTVFERTTRSIALTGDGRRFLPSAQAVLRQLQQAAVSAVDIRETALDTVRMAAPLVIAAVLLPMVIADLRRDTGLAVRLIDTPVVWLSDRVAIGEADLAVGPEREMPVGVSRTSLFATSWVLWCKPGHPLAARPQISWAELADTELFAAGRDHEQYIWPHLTLRDPSRIPRRVHIVDHITTALGLASSGLGVTFSPDYVTPLARSFGLVDRPLVEPALERQVALYVSEKANHAVTTARDYVIKAFAETTAKVPR